MVQIVGLKVHQLTEQIPIQLGTKGSKSRINHGMKACIKIGTVDNYHYFDVINIDRYDIIIGMVFMKQHGIVLDFENSDTLHSHGHLVISTCFPVNLRIVFM